MAGNINPNLQLGLNQQASFNVVNPVNVLETITNQNAQEEIGRQRNFQSGVNNAIAQAAANMRGRQAQEAEMARQLEAQAFKQQEAATQRAYEQQQLLEATKQSTQKELADINKVIAFNKGSIDQSNNLAQHRLNLLSKKADLELRAAETGFSDNEKFRNVMSYLDNELEATNSALGLPAASTSVGVSGINGQVPVEEQTAFEAAPGSTLLPDEMSGLQPITEQLSASTVEEDPYVSEMANSLKNTFKLKQLETESKIAKANGEIQDSIDIPVTKEIVKQTADEIFSPLGVEATKEEVELFESQDETRKDILKDKTATSDYKKKKAVYNDTNSNLFVVDDSAKTLQNTLEKAKRLKVDIDINAQNTLRALLDKAIDSEDNEGAQELLAEIKSLNIFDFPPSVPKEIREEITNDYLTALDQMEAYSSFIARGAGNTGVLTAKDVQKAMKKYISMNGNIDQFIQNLEKGRANVAADMMRQGYYYQNDYATKNWKKALIDMGYKVDSRGVATKVNKETGSMNVQFNTDTPESQIVQQEDVVEFENPFQSSIDSKLNKYNLGGF